MRRAGSRKIEKHLWLTGATITKSHGDRYPSLFLWIWVGGNNRQGTEQAEEVLAKLLKEKRVKARADEMGWDKGTVAFGEISLREKINQNTFEINEQKLVEEARSILRTIRKKDVEKLFEI